MRQCTKRYPLFSTFRILLVTNGAMVGAIITLVVTSAIVYRAGVYVTRQANSAVPASVHENTQCPPWEMGKEAVRFVRSSITPARPLVFPQVSASRLMAYHRPAFERTLCNNC